jgi:phenylacetate-CoA ligase
MVLATLWDNEIFRTIVNEALFTHYMLQVKRNQWRKSQESRDFQFGRLKAIIEHAYDYVPYYHRLFDSVNFKPGDVKSVDDLKKIPVTTKKDIQENYASTITVGIDMSKQVVGFTSGSTGTPLKIVRSRTERTEVNAAYNYPFLECGVKPADNFVTMGLTESIRWAKKYYRINPLRISTTVVPPYTSEKKLIDTLVAIDPDVISIFPSILANLSRYHVSDLDPKLIFTVGETLTQHCRDLVKDAFGLEINDVYGSEEFCRMAFECNEHCGLHVITDYNVIEFVDEDGESVASGEPGEIIITGLINRTSPLIRYEIGDLGIPSDEKCPCGRTWPIVKSIQGRTDDYVILPSGRRLFVPHLSLLVYEEIESNAFCVSQYQVVQEKRNRIAFKVVKGKKFDPDTLSRIKETLEAFFNKLEEDIEIYIQLVDEIPKERTGKSRVLISKIRQENF